jgi:hypothetical protein
MFFVNFAVFFKTTDGLLRYDTLKKSDKYGPTLYKEEQKTSSHFTLAI